MQVHPSRSRFRELTEQGTIVPVWCELLCDADTPVATFAALRGGGPGRFLLESAVGGERWARYSFVGIGYRARVVGWWGRDGLQVEVEAGPGFSPPELDGDARGLQVIRALLRHYRGPVCPDLPRFWGGLVGVWGHDLIRCIEDLPRPTQKPSAGLPVFDLLLTDTLVAFDNLSQRVRVYASACPETDGGVDRAYDAAAERIAAVAKTLEATDRRPPRRLALVEDVEFACEPAPPWTRLRHLEAVERGKQFIADGDIFQVVLSQRFDVSRDGLDPFDVYRTLRVTNPAPYMYLLELPSATLAGASPEVLVRVDRDTRQVTVRPIAGTRPRGRDRNHDLALEQELLGDAKERAEHLMLIDLGRNDVGRVSVPGTVNMQESFAIERYSRVMHIVSEVSGTLAPGLSAFDALCATFPAGTLSGAPKIRALEIIDALEPTERGWYGGAVGYLGYDGGGDFAICIRSVVCEEQKFSVQAGGGIVHDSSPEAEDLEARNKASAVLRAIAMARAGTNGAQS